MNFFLALPVVFGWCCDVLLFVFFEKIPINTPNVEEL